MGYREPVGWEIIDQDHDAVTGIVCFVASIGRFRIAF